MRKFFQLMIVAIVALTACCACSKVNDIDKRLGVLENIVSDLKAQISAGAVITSVDKTSDGCTFTLSNGQIYTVTNGKDGADGTDGEAIIADVKIEEDFVVLTLKNGETLRISYQNPLSMVTMSIVPDYDDGTVREPNTTEFNGEKSTIFCLDVAVTPARYAENLSDTERFIHKAVFSPVLTKSDFGNAFTVSPKSVIYAEGAPIPFLEASFELDEETVAALESTPYTVSYSIEDKDGVHGASTAFVPLNNETHSGWISSDDLANGGMAIEVGGHQVTVKFEDGVSGINKDIFLMAYDDGDVAKIEAFSKSNKGLGCVIVGDAQCQKIKTDNIYTFTISDISSDITATIGYQHVTGVSLDKTESSLFLKERMLLTATIIPDDACNGIIWTSSDDKIASVDGGVVTARNEGTATITATTVDGGKTAICTVTVVPVLYGALRGIFSVSEEKKVHFSRGNLYCSRTSPEKNDWTWHFYDKQYEFLAADMDEIEERTISSNENEIHLFTWGYNSSTSLDPVGINFVTTHTTDGDQLIYDKPSSEGGDDWGVAYCESNEIEVGTWRTLTSAEWQYLFSFDGTQEMIPGEDYSNDIRRGKNKCGVTVCGRRGCIVLLPDDWDTSVISLEDFADATEYNEETNVKWSAMEAAGAVCLPVTGLRIASNAGLLGQICLYWSSTSFFTGNDDFGAYALSCAVGILNPYGTGLTQFGGSVRLVTDVPAE